MELSERRDRDEILLLLMLGFDTLLLKKWIERGFGPDLYSHSAPTG